MAEGGSAVVSSRRKRILECSICLENFRDPKTLPCLHSFCLDCLINYAPQGTETLNCPLCKEEIEIPEKDVSNFKSNFHLKELIEEDNLTEKVTNSATEILCNCCDEDVSAVSRCLDCDQYLCARCLKAHTRFSALRDHVIANFDEIKAGRVHPRSNIKRQLMCVKHPNNKAEIFCTTCETPICHVCSSLKHKDPDHECIETVEAVEERRKEVLDSLKKLNEVKELFLQATKATEKEIEKSSLHVTSLKRYIELRSQRFVNEIESEKRTLFKEIDRTLSKDEQKLAEWKSSAKNILSNIESAFQDGKMMTEDSSDTDFLSLYATLKNKLHQLGIQKPAKYRIYTDALSFRHTANANTLNLGYIIQRNTISIRLCKEYTGDIVSSHDFYSMDMGMRITPERKRKIVWKPPQKLAVTDKYTNEVVILDACSLSENQKIRAKCPYDNNSDSEPICDVAFSVHDNVFPNCLYVMNHLGRMEIFVMDYSGRLTIRGKCAINTSDSQGYKGRSSIVADSENNILVGRTETSRHSLVRLKVADSPDSGTVIDRLRIPLAPCFLAFSPDYKDLIISDTNAGTAKVLEKAGKVKLVLDTEFFGQNAPTGVCCNESGCIYVASLLQGKGEEIVKSTICKYAPNGHFLASLGEFDHPTYGIVLTKEGKLAAACGDSVKLFDVQNV